MDLIARAKNMLMAPKTEWRVVAAEATDVASLYTGYIVPLAAIPPVCGFIGFSIVGMGGMHMGFGRGLISALVQYVLSLVAVYVSAFIASKIAPSFGGREDLVQALKLIAFSATASWVGGVFGLLPVLLILSAAMSLYSLYLLFVGAAVVMEVPEDRAVGYSVAVIVLTIGVFLILFYAAGSVVGHRMMGSPMM